MLVQHFIYVARREKWQKVKIQLFFVANVGMNHLNGMASVLLVRPGIHLLKNL